MFSLYYLLPILGVFFLEICVWQIVYTNATAPHYLFSVFSLFYS